MAVYGATMVHVADHAGLDAYRVTPYCQILAGLAQNLCPGLILMPASTQGNDLASAVAMELDYACVLDTRQISMDVEGFVYQRSACEGRALLHFRAIDSRAAVVTLKDGMVDVVRPLEPSAIQVIKLDTSLAATASAARVIRQELAKRTVNLKAAKIIVTAGAGVGSAETCRLVEKLADALGGELGATRPVVDAGWASAQRQIGQTGTTVKPDLYIACGVSGAVQHRVGIQGAKRIIAINTDPSAPIFKFADYCVLGDLKEVIPRLIDLIN